MLQAMNFQQGEKHCYDPHQIISKRRLEISCAPYRHEPNLELEKLANGGLVETQGIMEVETPLHTEKGLKRGLVDVIDLEGESSQSSKNQRTQGGET